MGFPGMSGAQVRKWTTKKIQKLFISFGEIQLKTVSVRVMTAHLVFLVILESLEDLVGKVSKEFE